MNVETIVLLVFHALLAPATALHALFFKRDPRASFGWIAVCVLFPLAGPIFYLFFGLNRARSRAQRMGLSWTFLNTDRGGPLSHSQAQSEPGNGPSTQEQTAQTLPTSPSSRHHSHDPGHPLRRAGQALSRHPLVDGNKLETLRAGEETFRAMLDAIAEAQHHILIATYIFDRDEVGLAVVAALEKAVARGVLVFVIIDGVGRAYSMPPITRRLQKAGVRVALFHRPSLLPPSISINMRSHLKIFLVDDAMAMTGGINISKRHLVEDLSVKNPTNDLHFRLLGPIVGQLRAEFDRLWAMSSEHTEPLPTPLVPQKTDANQKPGRLEARVVTDGPDEDLDRLTMLFVTALSQARHTVRIMTPYFLPPRELVSAIQAAAIRGVDVVLVLPSNNNLPFVHWATQNMLWELLSKDVKVIYQPPPFHHGKLLVIDEAYTIIGSSNWDARSLRLNFELQVEVYGESFAKAMHQLVDEASSNGQAVTLEELDGRGFFVRLRDSISWLFSPYL